MDYQVMFNITVVAVAFFGGWMVNRVFVLLDRLEEDMKLVPEKYIAKDDYREDIREIKEMLGAIFKRLENKADK
jgi:predicted phosphatase|tara:strand:+ start:351 stop:572 length:222 start_codon:yes stop_codon:yes gene_type:complete